MSKSHDSRVIAAYVRTAVDDPVQGRTQTDLCSEYSRRTFGTEPDFLFCDPGASGKSGRRRGLQDLVKIIRARRVRAVVAADLDRIHRNIARLATFFELMREYDVSLHSVSDGGPVSHSQLLARPHGNVRL
jgi:DNA invertase Pin-like site-specific DNA recombinase